MEGVTELATRLFFALTGPPPWMSTPFLRVTENFPAHRISNEFAPELDVLRSVVGYQLVPQVMASNQDEFIRIAEHFLQRSPFIEINCGCPSPTVVGGGAGSALLRSVDVFSAFIEKISKALGSGKLAVKMRTGYAEASEFPALVQWLTSLPLARLSVHGRTRADRYQGQARWDLIREAAAILPYGLWGSGDVCDASGLLAKIGEAPLEGVLIGRGALRNPWIFYHLSGEGKGVIDIAVLETALTVFALLQSAYLQKDSSLLRLADSGIFLVKAGTSVDNWMKYYEIILKNLSGSVVNISQMQVPLQAFSRTKMMWHYLRSGLPHHMNSPLPLRARNWSEFVSCLRHLNQKSMELELCHKSEHDWLYAGPPLTARSS